MYKKAEMGIGTLIIFIAMILVAAIAAGVLIQTAGSLQSKALITGERTQTQVSTGIVVTQAYAENGSYGSINNFSIMFKLAPGSDPIKLADTLVSVNLNDASSDLNYNTTATACASGSTTKFVVEYLISGTEHSTGNVVAGDVAKLCFDSPRAVTEDEEMKISIVPKTGSPSITTVLTPEVMSTKRIVLYP